MAASNLTSVSSPSPDASGAHRHCDNAELHLLCGRTLVQMARELGLQGVKQGEEIEFLTRLDLLLEAALARLDNVKPALDGLHAIVSRKPAAL